MLSFIAWGILDPSLRVLIFIYIYTYIYTHTHTYIYIYSIQNCFIGMTVNDTILPKLSIHVQKDKIIIIKWTRVCVRVYVVYEDTNLYNDMGMT